MTTDRARQIQMGQHRPQKEIENVPEETNVVEIDAGRAEQRTDADAQAVGRRSKPRHRGK